MEATEATPTVVFGSCRPFPEYFLGNLIQNPGSVLLALCIYCGSTGEAPSRVGTRCCVRTGQSSGVTMPVTMAIAHYSETSAGASAQKTRSQRRRAACAVGGCCKKVLELLSAPTDMMASRLLEHGNVADDSKLVSLKTQKKGESVGRRRRRRKRRRKKRKKDVVGKESSQEVRIMNRRVFYKREVREGAKCGRSYS